MIHLLGPRTGAGKEVLERLGERFAPEQARGVSAAVDLLLDTETGIERFQMQIENGQCSLARDRQRPAVTLRLALADLAGWIEGRADGANLFMSRRLTISGDVFLAVRLRDFFQLGRRDPTCTLGADRPRRAGAHLAIASGAEVSRKP